MLSYEILDGFIFAFVQFNCWIHVLILCFLGFAICALCHRSCLHARVVGGHFSMSFLYFIFFSLFDHCLLSFLCLSLDSLLAVSLAPSSLLSLSRVFFFPLCLAWLMSSALLYEVSIADRGVIVYCPLRKSLGCLNWLVYLALPGEVSIAGHGVIVYCRLRKSPGCLNRLVYMALLGEVSIG